ncbi:purine-nucleoside phosphorylase [Alkaliphilus oremlandii]|uniref:Purine nucleoside phosphorylase n=1 Tax=Alkaliphilus oremlandii (strain OhILAs) TaxID=350688 RepID=A8MFH1_ALKOO|nr:purine-nucleoside phosphorylase [Alkaliphilus oremlandii]ABW19134.1 inosine guanosine and xanthosine phosphorylase family [Alkaliphilus oremlandii OhILAs]
MKTYSEKILEAKLYLENKIKVKPEIGLILGSGLGILADEIKNPLIIPYDNIPNFPISTVEGHAGELVIGELMGKQVIALKGRFHYYEGYTMDKVTFPVRVMKAIGVENIIVTNAAGGVNKEFTPGDLMIIEDHINFGFDNPLIGPNEKEMGVRFPDMSSAYNKELIQIARVVAKDKNIHVKSGVYAFLTGPTYETPAEVRMMDFLGADAVGMSTVPEVIAAVHGGMKVLGISCITNMAAGILDQPLNHEEVIETTQRVKNTFVDYIEGIIESI